MNFNSILIVDDHPVVQAGLKAMVSKHCQGTTIRCATTVADALTMLATYKVDLLISDMQMPDGNALDIKKVYDGKIIIYTMHEEPWIVGEMIAGKVDAIVLKGDDSNELIKAIGRVGEGHKYFSERFEQLAKDIANGAPSNREKEILLEICEGKTSQDIAKKLCISPSTVNFHKKNMMVKSKTENVVQLVAKYLREGFIPIIIAMITLLTACQGSGKGKPDEASLSDSLRVMVEEANAESNHERALVLADSALNIIAEKDTNVAHLLYEKGLALFFMGKNEEALPLFGEAIDILDNYDKPEDAAIFQTTNGVVLRRLGRDQEALEAYTKAATMAKRIKDPSVSANIYNNVAVAYIAAKREKEAMAYLQQAEKLGIEAKDSFEIFGARSTMANLFLKQDKYDKVIETMRPAVDTLIAHGETMMTVRCASYLLSAYASTKRIAEADKLLKAIDPMLKELPEGHQSVVGIEQTRASLLESKGQHAEALAIYEKLVKMPALVETDIFRHLASCYVKLGQYSKAMAMQDSAYAALERMKDMDIDKQMSEFSIKYKTSEKELQISKLKEEKAKQMAWFVGILSAIIIVAVIVLVWLLARRKARVHQREIESKQRYIDGLEDERARLARELHDGVCNDLLGIGLTIDAGGEMDNVKELISNARHDIREISHALMPPRFKNTSLDMLIADHVSHLENTKAKVTFEKEDYNWANIPEHVAFQLYRIYQEAMSNAIAAQSSVVKVLLEKKEQAVELHIVNEYDAKNDSHGNGIGSQTIEMRANSIGGSVSTMNNGSRHSLRVTISMEI